MATIVIGVQWQRWAMAFEGVGDVRWRSTETAMVRQGGSETTAASPWAGEFDGGGVFKWRWRWTKARRWGQRETQQSNRGNGSGGCHLRSTAKMDDGV